jgi:hypothetical protein
MANVVNRWLCTQITVGRRRRQVGRPRADGATSRATT